MPRAGLSAEVLVDEAIRVVDEAGHDRLTLAELAKRFGVAQPSLYKHVDGLDALRRLLSIKVMRDMGDTLRRAGTGRAGSDALSAIAIAYRDFARHHPGSHAYILRAPDPADRELAVAADDILSVLFAVFSGYGIEGDAAVDAARFIRSALHGFLSLELAGGFEMPRSVDRSFARLVNAADQALRHW